MKFQKYNSIENSYRSKFIDRFAYHYNLDKMLFVMLEKIHGSNIQIMIDSEGNVKYASRNRTLPDDANFQNGLLEAKNKLDLSILINYCKCTECSVRLFGELCGDGIQKGIHYFKDKRILFFDIMVDDEYQSFERFKFFMASFELPMVPVVKVKSTLKEALEFDVESFISMVSEEEIEDNIAEGVVIRPMYEEMFNGDKRFILKYKSKKHSEKKQRTKKQYSPDPIVKEWRNKVLEYVTENRLLNLFSKEGMIEKPSQIGKYIGLFMKDVNDDFNKDYPEFKILDLTKDQKKRIMNYGNEVVNMLQNHL